MGEVHKPGFSYVQSRPIEMRATILYLANRWTEFEMLLTPLRFLYLVMFSLLAFPSIPQFIVQSRPIEMRATILYLANPWTEFEMLKNNLFHNSTIYSTLLAN